MLSGKQTTYFGGYTGYVDKLDIASSSYGDFGSTAYTGLIETPYMYGENIDEVKNINELGAVIKPTISSDITATLMVDYQADQVFALAQAGSAGLLGSFVLGTDKLQSDRMKIVYPTTGQPQGSGRNIRLKFECATLNANMEIHQAIMNWTIEGTTHN